MIESRLGQFSLCVSILMLLELRKLLRHRGVTSRELLDRYVLGLLIG